MVSPKRPASRDVRPVAAPNPALRRSEPVSSEARVSNDSPPQAGGPDDFVGRVGGRRPIRRGRAAISLGDGRAPSAVIRSPRPSQRDVTISLPAENLVNLSAQHLAEVLPILVAARPQAEIVDLTGCYLPDTAADLSDPTYALNAALRSLAPLTALHTLVMRRCALVEAPVGLFALTRLTKIDLGDNRLSGLPQALTRCEQLACLEIDNNKLVELPETLTRLPRLRRVFAAHNAIAGISPALAQWAERGRVHVIWKPSTAVTSD